MVFRVDPPKWLPYCPLIGWFHFEFSNEAWQGACPLCHVARLCFRDGPPTNIFTPPFDWLIHFDFSYLQSLNGFCQNFMRSKYSMSSTLCFLQVDPSTKWPTWPLIGWFNFEFYAETAERIYTKLIKTISHLCTYTWNRTEMLGVSSRREQLLFKFCFVWVHADASKEHLVPTDMPTITIFSVSVSAD